MSRRVAAIDCGTNSIRLLVAEEAPDGSLRDIAREMKIVRLGHGVDRTGRLDPEAIERTLEATRQYARVIEQNAVEGVRFAATSASRDAENRAEFIDGVREILGIEPEVIEGTEEAVLSYRGAVATLPDPGPSPRLIVDIGGGSTELVYGEDAPRAEISLDMGSVRLTERHLSADRVSESDIEAAVRDIDALMDEASQTIDFSAVRGIVGVAGTVTTLTAVALGLEEYTPEVSHGASIDAEEFTALSYRILRSSAAELSALPAIHPGRIDVIGAGALIWARILERVANEGTLERVTTSEHDILDGLAMSVLDSLSLEAPQRG